MTKIEIRALPFGYTIVRSAGITKNMILTIQRHRIALVILDAPLPNRLLEISITS